MFRNRKVQYAVLAGSLVVLSAIAAWRLLPGGRGPSPKELAHQALEAPTPAAQEAAALQLARLANDDHQADEGLRQEAKQYLHRVLAKSQSPPVQAACLQGLAAQWDYDIMPALLKALEHDSALVRGRAAAAIQRLLSVDLGYRYDDPPEKRRQAVRRIAKYWEQMRDSPLIRSWKKRLQDQGP
jgi:hypothetical protein